MTQDAPNRTELETGGHDDPDRPAVGLSVGEGPQLARPRPLGVESPQPERHRGATAGALGGHRRA